MGFCTDLELGRFKDDKNLGFHRNLAKLETPLHCLKPCFELLAIGKRHASDLGCRYIRSRNWSGRESFAAKRWLTKSPITVQSPARELTKRSCCGA